MDIEVNTSDKKENEHKHLVWALLLIILLFQLGIIKYTLGLAEIATVLNAVLLAALSALAFKNVAGGRFTPKVWLAYLMPGILIYTGYLLNIGLSMTIEFNAVSSLGLLIPWAAYLAVPFWLVRRGDEQGIWKFFYQCMLVVCLIGLLEYALVFGGLLSTRLIETPLGNFVSGGISVFHALDDGSPHYRFYAIFPEPGTFAMYLLPVMLYALVFKKYAAAAVFLVSLALTDSLGGFAGFLMLFLFFIYGKLRQAKISIGTGLLAFAIIGISLAAILGPELYETYAMKGQSREVREEGMVNVIQNLPQLIVDHPLGFRMTGQSLSATESEDYFGSTFALGTALATGGGLSLLGYFLALLVCVAVSVHALSMKRGDLDYWVVFPSLLVMLIFIVQRATVLDSALFALLFAPSIIRSLQPQAHEEKTPS